MATYILRRLGLAVVTLWLLSVIVFFAGQVLPGDPGRAILGPLAAQSAVHALDQQLGVDRPLLTQYWSWITGLLHGNMGLSYQFRAPVAPFIGAALVNSIKLGALAFVIVVPLSIFGGVVAALNVRPASPTGSSRSPACPATTVPEFVSGIVLIVIFGVELKWFPVSASARRGRVVRVPALSPDPARDPAGADPVRVHCADGAGRHDRCARVRLRAHRDAEGPASGRW